MAKTPYIINRTTLLVGKLPVNSAVQPVCKRIDIVAGREPIGFRVLKVGGVRNVGVFGYFKFSGVAFVTCFFGLDFESGVFFKKTVNSVYCAFVAVTVYLNAVVSAFDYITAVRRIVGLVFGQRGGADKEFEHVCFFVVRYDADCPARYFNDALLQRFCGVFFGYGRLFGDNDYGVIPQRLRCDCRQKN